MNWLARAWRRLRRNHALEHATMHMITASGHPVRIVGRSDPGGFWLYGDIDTALVRQTVSRALQALQSDSADLAFHPNCGTGPAVTLMTVGATGMVASHLPRRNRPRRRLAVAGLGVVALLLSPLLGEWVQRRLLTDPDLSGCSIASVREVRPLLARGERALLRVHRVRLRHEVA